MSEAKPSIELWMWLFVKQPLKSKLAKSFVMQTYIPLMQSYKLSVHHPNVTHSLTHSSSVTLCLILPFSVSTATKRVYLIRYQAKCNNCVPKCTIYRWHFRVSQRCYCRCWCQWCCSAAIIYKYSVFPECFTWHGHSHTQHKDIKGDDVKRSSNILRNIHVVEFMQISYHSV